MSLRQACFGFGILVATSMQMSLAPADDGDRGSFRDLLQLADIDIEELKALENTAEFTEANWQTLLQVFDRLQQFRELPPLASRLATQPEFWHPSNDEAIGELYEIQGMIVGVEQIVLPESVLKLQARKTVYRCAFAFDKSAEGSSPTVDVYASRVPRRWRERQEFHEPVRMRCVLLRLPQVDSEQRAVVATEHIAWYPTANVPTGQLLLARSGMDVALLDEVKHRQPFVKPEVSREGEAFYQGLKALRAVHEKELLTLARLNIEHVASEWAKKLPTLKEEYMRLVAKLDAVDDDAERKRLGLQTKRARTSRDLALTIARQAAEGQSSVATMFLQPEQEVGELFYFDGTARRAVWISVADQGELDGYYEVEVFPKEARLLDNRPIVCCVSSLPIGFPTGDVVREPVRMAGLFFKSWRYRSRDVVEQRGETVQQRQLYAPVLLAKQPIWLRNLGSSEQGWALWAGVAFLVGLLGLWTCLAWLARRDRLARHELRRSEPLEL